VRFVPGDPPRLAVRAEYRLANVGNAPLHSIGIELPGENSFGRADLHAEIDNKEVAVQHNPFEPADNWRISLPAAWRQKEKINLVLSYDLAARAATDPRIFAAANAFYLNDSGWFPQFQEPRAFFAADIVRPNPTDLAVTVPADFRVTASGQLRGAKKQNGESEYRFRIRKADFDPYVVAGQYNEQRVSTSNGTVVFWTSKTIPAAQAQQTARQIAAAEKFYSQNFGPLPRTVKEIYDIQPPEESSEGNISWERLEGSLLPGVVFDAMSGFSGPTELGNTWFGHMIRPRAEAWMFDFVLAAYASDLWDQGNGAGTSRADAIGSDLSDYDGTRGHAVEKPIISLTPSDSKDQLRLGGDKLELFLFALEDKCGQQNVTHAIAHMVYALRGQQYDYSDFRAALEQECHQNLSNVFDAWLRQKGIPDDFRARQENASGGKN